MRPSQISPLMTDTVTVKALAGLPEIQLASCRVGPFAADAEVELERWQAEILAGQAIVELPEDSNSLLTLAYRSRDKEQSGRALEPIDDAFQIFPRILRALDSEGILPQKRGALRTLFEDIIISRTNKIARAARMGQDAEDALNPEELWLYASLRAIFEIWTEDTETLVETEGNGET